MSASDISVNVETSYISINLNSNVLFIFLGGLYTPLYFGTVYAYYTKNSSKQHLVSAAITMLYLSIIAQAALEWYATKWEFVDNGDTRQSTFLAVSSGHSPWVTVVSCVLYCISFSIADGLLIWRCFHVWNRSWRIILVPLFLVGTEVVLYLVFIAYEIKYMNTGASLALATALNDVLAAAFFLSFGTTLVATVLIGYRIYSVSNQEGASSRRFKHVIDIVAQSGAVYALSQFVAALSNVLPGLDIITNARGTAFSTYSQILNVVIAGIATTVMVARVALLSADTTYPSSSVHLSGLQFHPRSTHPLDNMEEITPSINGNRILAGEGQTVEDKALLNIA